MKFRREKPPKVDCFLVFVAWSFDRITRKQTVHWGQLHCKCKDYTLNECFRARPQESCLSSRAHASPTQLSHSDFIPNGGSPVLKPCGVGRHSYFLIPPYKRHCTRFPMFYFLLIPWKSNSLVNDNVAACLPDDCFPVCGKKSNLVQSINHILGYLYLNMKGVHLKKIRLDYSETQTKGNGINMIKDFFTINLEIKVLYMILQKATWSPSILANEQFYCDFMLCVFNSIWPLVTVAYYPGFPGTCQQWKHRFIVPFSCLSLPKLKGTKKYTYNLYGYDSQLIFYFFYCNL